MEPESFDLSKMTVEDLFRAKTERRLRLAGLSFEQKIEIVKKLQSVSRTARAGQIGIDSLRKSPPLIPDKLQRLHVVDQFMFARQVEVEL